MKQTSITIIAATALMILALFHHPVASHHGDMRELALLAAKDQFIHGVLIAVLALLANALAALGNHRPAYAAYCLGCLLLGVAMLLDGFVVPRLAAEYSVTTAVGLQILHAIGACIQIFSKAGLIAHCVAILAWSCAAIKKQPWFAGIGMLAALPPAAALLFGDLRLTPHILLMIVGLHAIWYLAAARNILRYRHGG